MDASFRCCFAGELDELDLMSEGVSYDAFDADAAALLFAGDAFRRSMWEFDGKWEGEYTIVVERAGKRWYFTVDVEYEPVFYTHEVKGRSNKLGNASQSSDRTPAAVKKED